MSTGSSTAAQEVYINNQGIDIIHVLNQGGGVQLSMTPNGGIQVAPLIISANGAVNPFVPATYVITKAGVAALTLAAPTAGIDDGNELVFTSTTANAHTITTVNLLADGLTGSPHNTATFAAFKGSGLTLMAYQGLWQVISTVAITFS